MVNRPHLYDDCTVCAIPYPLYRYAVGVVLFKILTSRTIHPFLTTEDLEALSTLQLGEIRYREAGKRMSPTVIWPEGCRLSYPEIMIDLVESLLLRRGGLEEVREYLRDPATLDHPQRVLTAEVSLLPEILCQLAKSALPYHSRPLSNYQVLRSGALTDQDLEGSSWSEDEDDAMTAIRVRRWRP